MPVCENAALAQSDAELVAHPLHERAGDEHAALERVFDAADVWSAGGDRRDQAMRREYGNAS